MAYVDGFLIPVREENKERYRDVAERAAGIFREHGALRVVECWGDDVPHGHTTDFYRAVKAEEGEQVVFSWVVWPTKAVRDEGMQKFMNDSRLHSMSDMPFDGKRMVFGGFSTLVDTGRD
jgi:uncharacterized protein YbaA (DUF1428 family)